MNYKKKVLLTGSSGFVGSHFFSTFKDTFDILALSLRERKISQDHLQGIDVVLHCAGLAHQMRGAEESEYMRVNFELTKELAGEAKRAGVSHFIYISTAHVFGDSGSTENHQKIYNEESECRAEDPYSRSKILAENYLKSIQGMNFVISIIRPPMIYGKGGKGNLLSLVKLIQACPILPFAYSENKRSVISIENLIYFLRCVIDQRVGGILLPQDERPVSIEELTRYLAEAIGKAPFFFRLPSFVQNFVHRLFPKQAARLYGTLCLDSQQTNRRIGYQPVVSTQEAIRKMLA